jgi:putative transposase
MEAEMATATGQSKRRQYSDEQKRAIVEDARRMGVNAAARAHGMSEGNVSRWYTQARAEEEARGASAKRASAPRRREARVNPSSQSSVPVVATAVKRKVEPIVAPTPKRRVAKTYSPSQKAQVLEHAAKHGADAAAKKFGVSRFSVYEWRRRLAKAAAGEGPSPTSGEAPSEIAAQRDKEILDEWHRQPGLGPSQIKNQLRRAGVKVSVHTVRRVMEEQGYRPPKVKREGHEERYEAVRPNQMWHLDCVHRLINRAKTFTLILIDDQSRFVVGHGVDEVERAELVIGTFEQAVTQHGRPETVMHDKGSAFWSWRGISRFTALLTEMGIDQIPAEHKEWNGKVEVFNANLHKELFDAHRFYDVAEMRRRLATHLEWYNHARTHHALGGMLVPADRYYGRVEQVLARIESGAGRDVTDLQEVRERCLELFKVTSRAGVPEVWLLGHKLLELPLQL